MDTSLEGKLLIAMPGIRDGHFARALVFVCAHSDQGAMGLIINKAAPLMHFSDLLEEIDLSELARITPEDILGLPVRLGGPVEQFRGFVLHSDEYFRDANSLKISGHFVLSSTTDILKDIALGKGPLKSLVALGYSGWAPGQLENEILHNGWLHCDADSDLIYSGELEKKHSSALLKIGVVPGQLSSDFGHA